MNVFHSQSVLKIIFLSRSHRYVFLGLLIFNVFFCIKNYFFKPQKIDFIYLFIESILSYFYSPKQQAFWKQASSWPASFAF